MKNYTTFEEIEYDLKRLSLERQIALEELKGVKSELKDDLKPVHWMQTVFKYASKYGSLLLLKKIIK
ncbi:hypothetical protein [Psychroserpens algicola]|uniref:Glutaminyl-tRNA synthetase n=1 Tax=Psychroserpens algicola TaxID=1719034 RepID=A0ABT0HCH1_9FLAO|nr:hypothetical protein [Psychroserpens algicola]MCK8482055.1 hypothetical protein [Psychroserpens algicola]